ncbi:hypothetical protein DPMN_088616 [Dreissena polymorpha]|uniref:Uncharacterized protein n=1 Tax=Dreissena polymorpha TaxID=45954 RepID=A0A9D4QWJ7_DREPO|nr:hypothetical protein DPMN_088616 [Dreissena polymorpha]
MVNAAQLSSWAIFFAVSAMLTSIASITIDTWEITNRIPSSGNFRRGLWRACEDEICDRLPDTSEW